MAQHALTIPDSDGASFLAALNAALAALKTMNSGTGRPPSPSASQFWVDTNTPSATVWTLFMFDGAEDIEVGTFDTVANRFTFAGSTIGRQLQWAADAAAARGAISAETLFGAAITTGSGSAAAWTGLPAGLNWIALNLQNFSTTGSAIPLVRLGTGGGPTYATTNHQASAGTVTDVTLPGIVNSAAAFPLASGWSASVTVSGRLNFQRMIGNTWTLSGSLARGDFAAMQLQGGVVVLPAELTAIQLSTADAFDAGVVNATWGF